MLSTKMTPPHEAVGEPEGQQQVHVNEVVTEDELKLPKMASLVIVLLANVLMQVWMLSDLWLTPS